MVRSFGTIPVSLGALLTLSGCGVLAHASIAESPAARLTDQIADYDDQPSTPPAVCGPDPANDRAPARPSPGEALAKGVLVVVSIPSQKLFVFKDGIAWGSTTVSTGRAGHGTPAGVFPILQKHVRHRSNLYNNASMPYMQRLTWGGVALHAGHVTGRPASHGCIRMPWGFARNLYAITNPASTSVLIVREPLQYAEAARNAVTGGPRPAAYAQQARPAPAWQDNSTAWQDRPAADGEAQMIQLAATPSPQDADVLWQQLEQSEPELQDLSPVIIPATVRAVQVYRLRASGTQAHALCSRLMARGVACMKIYS
jgi:hypothetical protein